MKTVCFSETLASTKSLHCSKTQNNNIMIKIFFIVQVIVNLLELRCKIMSNLRESAILLGGNIRNVSVTSVSWELSYGWNKYVYPLKPKGDCM
jgi:hypothetical protein